MKLSIGLISFALFLSSPVVSAGIAHGHQHHHRRQHNGHVEVITQTITQTVTVVYGDEPTSTPSPKEDNVFKAEAYRPKTSQSTATTTSTTSTILSTTEASTTSIKPTETSESEQPKSSPPAYGNIDPEAEFRDGEVSCDVFPSAWGAVPIDWLKTGGWTSIQIGSDAGKKCEDGAYCSYACPPGYSKAQWPAEQPASGESRGGLLCKDGKLWKTRPQNKGLCMKGHGGVYVKNELSQFVPVCRTDYPGSENMVIPVSCSAGSTQELTVPESATGYIWQGKQTSAQYYVNPAGTPLDKGCVWGDPNGNEGNWSPMVFGAGYTNGVTWLSISQNQLNGRPLGYNVKIVPGPGAKMNGDCKYENGVFSGGTAEGCTAALISGDAYFVLYK